MAQLWFKFWSKDYLADAKIAMLSYERRGILQTLWAYAWEEGSIPSDPELLGGLLRIDANAMRTHCDWIATFFVKHPSDPTRLVSPRLELERVDVDLRGAKARESAKKRWDKHLDSMRSHSEGNAKAMRRQCVSHASQSQSTESTNPPTPLAGGRKPKGRSYGLTLTSMAEDVRGQFLRAWGAWPTQAWHSDQKVWGRRRTNQEGAAKRFQEILEHNTVATPRGPKLTAVDLADVALFFVGARQRHAERTSTHLNVPTIENFFSTVERDKANPWQNAAAAWIQAGCPPMGASDAQPPLPGAVNG